MATRRKSVKAVATLSGRMSACAGTFEYALGSNKVWYLRTNIAAPYEEPVTSRWAACESPLGEVGISSLSDTLDGQPSLKFAGEFSSLPGLEGYGFVNDLFICGDIGHRYRLPLVV